MNVLFLGGDDAFVDRVGGTTGRYNGPTSSTTALVATTSTEGNIFIGAYGTSLASMVKPAADAGAYAQFKEAANYFWFTCSYSSHLRDSSSDRNTSDTNSLVGSTAADVLSFCYGNDRKIVFRISAQTTIGKDTWVCYKRDNAGSLVELGRFTFPSSPMSIQYRLDIEVSYGSQGFVRVYLRNSTQSISVRVMDSGTVDTTADGVTELNGFVIGSVRNGASSAIHTGVAFWMGCVWMGLAAMRYDSREAVVGENRPSGPVRSPQGLSTQDYTAINAYSFNDVRSNTFTQAGQWTQYYCAPKLLPNATALGSMTVQAVSHGIRAKTDGASPTKFNAGAYLTTDMAVVYKGTVFTLTTALKSHTAIYEQEPLANKAWSAATMSSTSNFNFRTQSYLEAAD